MSSLKPLENVDTKPENGRINLFFFGRVDQAGVICKQEGITRVNCMDCLDRTNVVQAAIARVVMEHQVSRLLYLT